MVVSINILLDFNLYSVFLITVPLQCNNNPTLNISLFTEVERSVLSRPSIQFSPNNV